MLFKSLGFSIFFSLIAKTEQISKQAKTKEKSYISMRKDELNFCIHSDIHSSMFTKLMRICYVWRPKGGRKKKNFYLECSAGTFHAKLPRSALRRKVK